MGKIGSFLASLMLSVPVAFVGLVALFGMPQVTPTTASASGERVDRGVWGETQERLQEFGSMWSNQPAALEETSFSTSAPAWATSPEFSESRPEQNADVPPLRFGMSETRPNQQPQQSSGFMAQPASEQLAHNTSDFGTSASFPGQVATPTQPRAITQPALTDRSARMYSWSEASQQLQQLGIDDFHLERGAQDGTFLFVCSLTPGDTPNVMHRFEAESPEPLAAVNQVLNQVQGWLGQRYAARRFPATRTSL